MKSPANFDELLEQIRLRILPFTGAFFVIVLLTYMLLYIIDVYPEPKEAREENTSLTIINDSKTEEGDDSEVANITTAALPVKIVFDELDKEIAVLNPTSRSVADLDAALLEGVVRHPDSADFQNTGNIFILGHSSYLPNVMNKNFQAFNGIQNLDWGDTIRLWSTDTEYVYRVDRVYKAKASEVTVPLDTTRGKLTLATCNSFGSKDDRFMVEATLVSKKAL
ncbi:hypothetical protein CL653_02150 [bacterium]|mgnify:CR=1 FL=1|nr:hypothetical protein [bacterium]|tara:strand:- start:333 stop:1001 length:669 start_codon:yes stop_codon:yes gene_type:complete